MSIHTEQYRPEFTTKEFENRNRAIDYIYKYIPSFCVYCQITRKLYTSYELINAPKASSVIVLPTVGEDIFNVDLDGSIIKQSPYALLSSKKLQTSKLVNIRNKKTKDPYEALANMTSKKLMMPVILKENLRRVAVNDLPYLLMHSIDLEQISTLSNHRKDQISDAIIGKIEDNRDSLQTGSKQRVTSSIVNSQGEEFALS